QRFHHIDHEASQSFENAPLSSLWAMKAATSAWMISSVAPSILHTVTWFGSGQNFGSIGVPTSSASLSSIASRSGEREFIGEGEGASSKVCSGNARGLLGALRGDL